MKKDLKNHHNLDREKTLLINGLKNETVTQEKLWDPAD